MAAVTEDRVDMEVGASGGPEWEQPGPCDDAGEWLADRRRRLAAGEASWLLALADFDLARGWALDGHVTCVDWLMWRAGLGRTTAFEKLRVAHELRRRPVLADALASGRASYCAVRAMVRAPGADPAVDRGFVAVAESGTVTDVEHAVHAYLLHASQDQPPDDRTRPRGVRLVRRGDGTTRLEAVLTDDEAAELDVAIDAHLARTAKPVDECARADAVDGEDRPDWLSLRADALMDLARSGVAAGHSPGSDRYMVHLVVQHGHGCLQDGQPLPDATTERILCDCSTVTHHLDARGVPLMLGRRTREWSTAQRRAILVRDGGHCRWPGCRRTHVDVHHVRFWDRGGPTDIANGIALCPRHHTALHTDFRVTGSANGRLDFHRPNGTVLGASR